MPYAAKWTDEQREAVAHAVVDRGILPAQRVADLAAAGELDFNGARLDAFPMPVNTVRDCARKLKARRAGKLKSDAAMLPARDAVEALRRRLVSLADREMKVAERQKRGTVQPETLRQIARAVREIAAIPGIDDARPIQPGQGIPGTGRTAGGHTRGGMAGAILRASDAPRVSTQDQTATETSLQTGTLQGEDARDARVETQDGEGGTEGDGPGAWVEESLAVG